MHCAEGRKVSGNGLVFECFYDHFEEGAERRRWVSCAILLAPAGGSGIVQARWQFLLLKHGLRALKLEEWPQMAKQKKWGAETQTQLLTEFVDTIKHSSQFGICVSIAPEVWQQFLPDRKRQFGSPHEFCFLRSLRLALDRLETSAMHEAGSFIFPRDLISFDSTAHLLMRWFNTDSRASEYAKTIEFVDIDRSAQLQASSLMARMGMRDFKARNQKRLDLSQAQMVLPPLPSFGVSEFWDQQYADRHGGGVEWDLPMLGKRRLRVKK